MATQLESQYSALFGVPVVIREPPRRFETPFPVDSAGNAIINGRGYSGQGDAFCAGCGYVYLMHGKHHGYGPCFCATDTDAGR